MSSQDIGRNALGDPLGRFMERILREMGVARRRFDIAVTEQLAAILERRRSENGEASDGWVFPSRISRSGRVADLSHMYEAISRTGGEKFWFHGLRNCFITVAERDLLLPLSLTKRLVNHARPSDVTEGYAADWTIAQLREPAQRIADRIEALMMTRPEPESPAA